MRRWLAWQGLSICAVGATLAATIGGCAARAPIAEPAAVPATPKANGGDRSAVLFVVAFDALLPIGCHDARTKRWSAGAACLDLVPDDAEVLFESGRRAKTGGTRTPVVSDCTLPTKLLRFEPQRPAEAPSAKKGAKAPDRPLSSDEPAGSWAIWSTGDPPRPRRLLWEGTKKGSADLADGDLEQLAAAWRALASGDELRVVQGASADLDDDGTSELYFSVHGAGFDPAARTGTSALLFAARPGAPLVPVRTSNHAVYRVDGVVDLDGDGRSELWLTERTFHETGLRTDAFALARRDGGALTPLEAIESCSPRVRVGRARASD
jgi:hypothetical protein